MKLAKRLCATLLVACMMLGLVPGLDGLVLNASAATIDAFGISMSDWGDAEKEEAEKAAPFGVGYETKTSLITRSELYVSMGYDSKTRRTGVSNWDNSDNVQSGIQNYASSGVNQMTSSSVSYDFVETAPMDLYDTGKDEYVANLAYSEDNNNSIYLFITNSNNQTVAGPITVASGGSLSQLKNVDTYEIRGAIAVAAGDFDGDGVDTILVYVPYISNSDRPFIREYKCNGSSLRVDTNSTISNDVYSMLGVTGLQDLSEHDLENQPMVSLVAEDTDKDGFDELVVTAGLNDVDSDNDDDNESNGELGSQLFVYDKLSTGWSQSFSVPLNVNNGGTANTSGRIVRASSTVGNMLASTSTNTVDYHASRGGYG